MTDAELFSRNDLRDAAKSEGFDMTLPLLVRRLIDETAVGLTELDMPGGGGVAASGFDGIVTATGSSAFVPDGTSGWELSIGGGQAKADDDYSKRDEAPHGLKTEDVTYIEVILEPWTKARSWKKEKDADHRWKEVRAYNVDRVHAWLDTAPATKIWLASRMGKMLPGIRHLTEWWETVWLPSTRIPLDSSVVLAGRDKAVETLFAKLDSGQRVISLGGDLRVDEASAFVAASLEQEVARDRSRRYYARTLLVSDAESLVAVASNHQPLILVLSDATLARELPDQHNHLLIIRAASGAAVDVDVPLLDAATVEAALGTDDVSDSGGVDVGVLGRRSLLALRRSLALNPAALTPSWAMAPDATTRRLLLIGSWQANSTDDQRIVMNMVGVAYDEVSQRADELSQGSDMPLTALVGDVWHIASAQDAWALLSASLTTDDFTHLGTAVHDVLMETDPRLELEPQDRWRANLDGARRLYSTRLRRGLAETLALAGSNRSPVRGTESTTTSDLANRFVYDLLSAANNDATHRLWYSLTDVLSLLAEAAPEVFLDAMKKWITETSAGGLMFTDNEDAEVWLGPSSPHSSFLWALESLAWSPDYIDGAVDVLGALAEIDPGGKLSNRPVNSLVEILSAWAPNTTAGTQHRCRCIRRIARNHPGIASRLLLALIPNGHGFQSVHSGPTFRDWKRKVPITYDDLGTVVATVVDALGELLTDDPELYVAVVKKLDDLTPELRGRLLDRYAEVGSTVENDESRATIFEALREQIAHHREYADTTWALDAEELDKLQVACDQFTPKSAVKRNRWLFADHWVTLGDVRRRDDYDAYDKELASRRHAATAEVVAESGVEGVIALAAEVSAPSLVGLSLAEQTGTFDADLIGYVDSDDPAMRDLTSGYFTRRLAKDSDLLDGLLAGAQSTLAKARLLRFSSDVRGSTARLAEMDSDVGQHYWAELNYWGVDNLEQSVEVAYSLIDAGRPAAALKLLVLHLHGEAGDEKAAEAVAAGLEALLVPDGRDPELSSMRSYDFERLFALLAKFRDSIGEQRVFLLEWQLYPLLGFEPDAPTLNAAIVENPSFFVELVTACFKRADPDSADEDATDSDAEERRRSIARRAYEVLRSCHRCPGVDGDGNLDADRLVAWVTEARQLLAEAGRTDIGDVQIGELLANGPRAEDESPIATAIRDLLEEVGSDDLDRGLDIGIANSRGVTSRGVYDGGGQEWELAKKYREWASAATDWPRTKRILTRLADSYEADARREDTEAERRRQGLGW